MKMANGSPQTITTQQAMASCTVSGGIYVQDTTVQDAINRLEDIHKLHKGTGPTASKQVCWLCLKRHFLTRGYPKKLTDHLQAEFERDWVLGKMFCYNLKKEGTGHLAQTIIFENCQNTNAHELCPYHTEHVVNQGADDGEIP